MHVGAPPPPVIPLAWAAVVTSARRGAGDAFMTGLIDKLWDVVLLGGHHRDQVRNISTEVLRQVIKVAALSVALTVARPGAAYRIGPPAIGRPTGC